MEVLDERYTTLNTNINTLSNKFVVDWMENVKKIVDSKKILYTGVLGADIKAPSAKNPETLYDKLFTYFHLLVSTNYRLYKPFFKIYKLNGYKIKVYLTLSKNFNTYITGFTRYYKDGSKEPYIRLEIPRYMVLQFHKNVMEEETLDYVEMRDFVSSMKSSLTHELTHFFQIKNKKYNFADGYIENGSLYGKHTGYLSFFNYFIQDSEMEAVLNSAYKIYKQSYNNNSFFNCVVFCMGERIKPKESKMFLRGQLTIQELYKKLNCLGKFLIIWSLYVYIPTKSKFNPLLQMSDEYETEFDGLYNAKIVEANAKNLTNFIKKASYLDGGIDLNNYLKKQPSDQFVAIHKTIFSLTKSNKKFLDDLMWEVNEF